MPAGPGARLFDKMLLCAHLELVVFLVTTLVGIPALVRRLIPKADPRVVSARVREKLGA